ncbi:MAG: LacI family DNA-binding transcriptional regulator [Burkholderiaceae bacterium]|nr:LacI family DNA-binding transcriptional regulator [Burkholderiaceae bacterium]
MQPQPNRKPTIYDIAQLAGASPSTVSAALGDGWKARRISEATVELIRRIATEQGYSRNMQARGLRRARSGLVGMLIPVHDNRFFASMSQSFEVNARQRGLVPVIASSLRDPAEESRVVETLIAYNVDALFVAGAANTEAISVHCAQAGMRHIFIDLPGRSAPSVLSDNFGGASQLTNKLFDASRAPGDGQRAAPYFLGGSETDYASAQRIAAFRAVCHEQGAPVEAGQIITCGYSPRRATEAVAKLLDDLGGLPPMLFVNSLRAFEGVLGHFVTLPPEAFADTVIGCYDYDPFAAFLQFPVHMVRQNAHGLITRAFEFLDAGITDPVIAEVAPDLIPPRTIFRGPFAELG